MKKLIVSMMLIAMSAAFAAESAPSAKVGYVRYTNTVSGTNGNNFIAYPLNAGYTMASDLDPSATTFNSIAEWNNTSKGWNACEDLGGFWDNDFAISTGKPLMVNALANGNFVVSGSVQTSAAYNFVVSGANGTNAIMHPLTKASLTMAGEGIGADIGSCSGVAEFISSTKGWNSTEDLGGFWDNDYSSEIGKALLVNATAQITWPGAKGDDVVEHETVTKPKGTLRTLGINIRNGQNGNALYDFSGTNPDPDGKDGVTFFAYIEGRDTEKLRHADTGCGFTYNATATPPLSACRIQAGNFPTPWNALENIVFVIQHTYSKAANGLTKVFQIPDAGTTAIFWGYTAAYMLDGPWSVNAPSSIEDNVPAETKLHQNYPNPFNPVTTIKFDLAKESVVKLNVYNYNGQLVRSLVDGTMNAGYHNVNFDASSLSAGVYYYTMETAGLTKTHKMVLVK